jgi:Uma2 family endonuclease
MVALQDLAEWLQANDPEERQIISGVSWQGYETLLQSVEDSLRYRVTYLDGVLDLVSPSRRHESRKTTIGSLIEDYLKEKRIRYFPLGSTTLRNSVKQAGVEPDESYCIGCEKEIPDLAIEVVVTSGGLDKLEIYQRLGVQEVWFFKGDRVNVYGLQRETYELLEASQVLPDLDLALLVRCANAADPLEAAIAFREQIRA